jgi:hypothetical protein
VASLVARGEGLRARAVAATLLVCAAFRLISAAYVRYRIVFGGDQSGCTRPGRSTTRSSEGRILAASRPAKTSLSSSAYAPRRVSFGRITEHLEVPNLLAIQNDSFDWLVGNEAWASRTADDRMPAADCRDSGRSSHRGLLRHHVSLFSAPRRRGQSSIEECERTPHCVPLFASGVHQPLDW